jgi:hypothetical protein
MLRPTAFAFLIFSALLFSACGIHTRAAVKNSTSAAITVTVSDGDDQVAYETIQPGNTSKFEKLSFSTWNAIKVIVTGGKTNAVSLVKEKDNTIVVGDDGASVESAYNKENEWW